MHPQAINVTARIKQEEPHDPVTGELLPRAADGGRLPPPAATFGDTIRLLNDGQFDADLSEELRRLVAKLEAHAFINQGRAKGSVTLKLDVELRDGAHTVTPSFKIVEPVAKRRATILFAHEDGRLSRNPPGQAVFFGLRDVSASQQQPTRDA